MHQVSLLRYINQRFSSFLNEDQNMLLDTIQSSIQAIKNGATIQKDPLLAPALILSKHLNFDIKKQLVQKAVMILFDYKIQDVETPKTNRNGHPGEQTSRN